MWAENLTRILDYDIETRVGFSAPNKWTTMWKSDFDEMLRKVQDNDDGSGIKSLTSLAGDSYQTEVDKCWMKKSNYGKAWCIGGWIWHYYGAQWLQSVNDGDWASCHDEKCGDDHSCKYICVVENIKNWLEKSQEIKWFYNSRLGEDDQLITRLQDEEIGHW